ncbi:NADH-quinone oxidoreductase subunit NuoE [Pedococcus sp.]|uniref:NADH-quinone oxidoreductase subunit NuoE n=1 Tax=Pedococcus sp. TaxID=2860345 RepID=UPI002E12A434|nr:NADH-quinone oxidoreductase subunit NuoE [Pedococcus sp.]
MPLTDDTRTQMRQIIARYPRPRSALLPMLHLVQAEEGYVTTEGVALCAQMLELSTAEVSAVATFYSMYKRRPVGDYHVGVCTNTLCAVLGGDAIFAALKEHLDIGNDETTPDGALTLEHIECSAACDYAPVVMVNWEFFDNQTPESTKQLVDDLRAGKDVAPSRGASRVCSFKQVSRVLAGFHDGLADEGVGAGPASLEGLRLARDNDWTAPGTNGAAADDHAKDEHQPKATSVKTAPGRHTSTDSTANAADEKPGDAPATLFDETDGKDEA